MSVKEIKEESSQIHDFEITEKINLHLNIVHDYLSDKPTPPIRPSLQPSSLTLPQKEILPPPRQTISIPIKENVLTKPIKEEIIKEKKEVRFEEAAVSKPKSSKHDETIDNTKNLDLTIQKNETSQIIKDIMKEIPKETPLKIPDDTAFQRKKEKKEKINKTVIIQTVTEEEKETISSSKEAMTKTVISHEIKALESPAFEKEEKRLKSHTYCSPHKKYGKSSEKRNSKLLKFAKIVDPLEKIDHDHHAELNIQIDQKLIFSDENEQVNQQKYMTFSKNPMKDLKSKIEQEDSDFGKFSCIAVIFHFFYKVIKILKSYHKIMSY